MSSDDPQKDSFDEGAEVFDFLEAYFEDLEAGESHDLSHYLRRFPGREESISREFLAQRDAEQRAREPLREVRTAGGEARDESRVGPYELVSEIGRGGQGVVYLAEDSRIQRRVALKVLPPAALLLSHDRRHRLRREAEVVSRLAHPGICGIYDAEIGDELAYIAMPFVEGSTLAALIAAGRDRAAGKALLEGGAPPVPVAPESEAELFRLLELFEDAARALHSAHEAGIVHRDVKPGNLMVTPEGRPVWLDFGQARDASSSMLALTMSGEIFGTPAYMSPEQVGGGHVDARTDVWALGVSLFEALTLERPFEGASAHGLMLSIQRDEPRSIRGLSAVVGEELAVVVETALERDPARRYGSALALAEDLARLRRREPIQARPASRALRLRRWVQRHPVVALAILSLTVGLVVSTALLVRGNRLLRHALGRHLAERAEALLEEDPASALVLGIEAVEHASNYLTRDALFQALEACQLKAVFPAGDDDEDPNRILDVALVPGAERMVAGRTDGSVALYDLSGGRSVDSWMTHGEGDSDTIGARVVAVSPDGRWVASGGRDGSVIVRDLDGEQEDQRFDGPGGEVSELVFGGPEGRLAVRGEGGGVELFELASGASVAVLIPPGDPPARLEVDRWNHRFVEVPASGASLERLRVWNTESGALEAELESSEPIRWAGVSPGKVVGIDEGDSLGSWDLTEGPRRALGARVLDAAIDVAGRRLFLSQEVDGVERCRWMELDGDGGGELPPPIGEPVLSASFSPCGDRLAVIRADGVLRIWDVRAGRVQAECFGYLAPSTIEWSADGESILTGRTHSPEARLWYANQPPDVFRLSGGGGPVVQVRFSPAGDYCLTRTSDGIVRVWPPLDGTNVQFPGYWRGASFYQDGDTVVAWGDVGLQLMSPSLGADVDGFECSMARDLMERLSDYRVVHYPIEHVSVHPSEPELLAIDKSGGAAILRGWLRGEDPLALEAETPTRLAEYAPDEDRILTAHQDGSLRLWSRSTDLLWTVESPTEGEQPTPVALAFDPTGHAVAVAWSDRMVRFFLLEDGSEWRGPLSVFPVRSIDWASDGVHFLVTGTQGRGAVRVVDLLHDNARRAEVFHADDITDGSFSPDGRLVMTSSLDGTVMVSDVSGEVERSNERKLPIDLVAHIQGGGPAALCAAFSPGPGPLRVIVGFEDGTAGVWPVDPLPAARTRVPRGLADWEVAREQRFAQPLSYR